jgi:hypothetical protein
MVLRIIGAFPDVDSNISFLRNINPPTLPPEATSTPQQSLRMSISSSFPSQSSEQAWQIDQLHLLTFTKIFWIKTLKCSVPLELAMRTIGLRTCPPVRNTNYRSLSTLYFASAVPIASTNINSQKASPSAQASHSKSTTVNGAAGSNQASRGSREFRSCKLLVTLLMSSHLIHDIQRLA